MGKSSSGRSKNGSEVSSRSERRRTEDEDGTRTRSRADSTTTSSSRRKSSRRDDDEQPQDGFIPSSTSFSSSSRSPYTGVAAPSVASSYATAYTNESTNYSQPPDLIRNESMADKIPKEERRESRRDSKSDSKSKSKSERSRGTGDSEGDSKNVGRRDSERGSRRESRKSSSSETKQSSRSYDEYNASLPQNQFPGEIPSQYTEPYRPPGFAADYYGDQGESVSYQPGVRPNPPSIIQSADQAHLMEPTSEPNPPPEPSSLGQIGAAASFFGGAVDGNESAMQSTPSKPGRKSSLGPAKNGKTDASSRTSPGPQAVNPRPGAIGPMGSAAMATGIGAAAEYYTGNISITAADGAGEGTATASNYQTAPSYQTASPDSYVDSSRPPKNSDSGSHHYGTAAAVGLAGVAAGAYFAGNGHSNAQQQPYSGLGPDPNFTVGHNQSAFPQMQQRHRHKRRGPLGKFVDFFKDPQAVAEYEQYTEATGLCKYCFDPNSTPADAPRRHHYHRRRPSSGSRYGSSTRVDKIYRNSSDDDRRKSSSTTKKVLVGGLAGYGAAKIGEALYNQKNDFDDTYSVKSGLPVNRSRVSFRDGEDVYKVRKKSKYGSTEDVRLERHDSGRKSRRESDKYERRSSGRRDSSSNSSAAGISRGAALSLGAGAAGLAMGAAAINDRRRSRSRSRSPSKKKRYYSKRVSPRHSYVDLSTTNTGPTGFGDFFSSPSANKKRGKRAKGLFNFANASSSSSDADLAFGEGTVRRKTSQKGRSEERKSRQDGGIGSTAAILGLAATGMALAEESDRRKGKGKERRDTNRVSGRDSRPTNGARIGRHQHAATNNSEHDEAWEDASDDDRSQDSIDLALAYGGRLSARQSRESLADQGTSKWDWRWNKGKDKTRKGSESRVDGFNVDPATAGLEGAAAGIAAAGMMSKDSTPMRPMQVVEPVPTADATYYDVRRVSQLTGVSPLSSTPQLIASSASIPLQQPQPVTPIASVPDAFGRLENGAGRPDISRQADIFGRREVEREDRRTRHRRDSSPAKLPSRDSRNSVAFSLTNEQVEAEQRAREKEERRRRRREERERRKSLDSTTISGATAAATPESPESRRISSADARAAREAEIEAELQKLYEEDRKLSEQRKRKEEERKRKVETAGVAAAAAAVGAGFAAAAISGKERPLSESEGDSKSRRKSSMKKPREREVSPEPEQESQQERIARMAAKRVRSTPSPVHEDYSTFFVPAELAEHVKEHNERAEQRDEIDAHVVEIIPGDRSNKETFDPFNYRPFGLEVDDDPTVHPWPVPMLGLIEPTPPGSRSHSERGDASPLVTAARHEPEGDVDEIPTRKVSTGSKVTWGDHDTYVYEVQTPEYERSDFLPESPEEKSTAPPSKLNRVYTLDDDDADTVVEQIPPVEKMSREQQEHVASGKEFKDLPRSQGEDDRANVTKPADASPAVEVNLEDKLGGSRSFYQTPFAETVSDLGITGPAANVPITGHGFVEDAELPQTPKGVNEISAGPRSSKSERRREERAASSREAVQPTVISAQSGPINATKDVEPQVPGGYDVFDYLVDDRGASAPAVSSRGAAETSVLPDDKATPDAARKQKNRGAEVYILKDEDKQADFKKPKRASTFDESRFETPRSKSTTDYASDPEDWEKSSTSKKSKDKGKSSSKSDIGVNPKVAMAAAAVAAAAFAAGKDNVNGDDQSKRRKSKRESEIMDDDDVKSVVSSPATLENDEKKSRRKSKRDSEVFDDDTRSVASSPADSRKKSSKDKEKKSGGGIFSNFFSSSKSDVSTSSKRSSKSSKSEGRADRARSEDSEKRKKRRSKDGKDFDDISSAVSESTRKSRRDSAPLAEQNQKAPDSRDQSVEDGFVSAEEAVETSRDKFAEKEAPFLVKRPEVPEKTVMDTPMATEGVSGLTSERDLSDAKLYMPGGTAAAVVDEPETAQERPLPQDDNDDPSRLPEQPTPSTQRLSTIKTTDIPSSPALTSSPTAVPIHFRRLPISPANNPRASISSPVASPISPLTTPRTRQGRPKSTEFRSGKEFRPLYLVEKSNVAKATTPEIDEDLPALPSSRNTSAHPSIEDLRSEAQASERQDYFTSERISPEMFRERGRRHSHSYWHDEPPNRRESPDYLDSRSATPVPTDAQKSRDLREPIAKKEKPKYEFHSPSELLQDPAMHSDLPEEMHEPPARVGSPLPSVVSTERDLDYASARSGSRSPTGLETPLSSRRKSRSRSKSRSRERKEPVAAAAGLGLLGGAALGLAASEVLGDNEDQSTSKRELRKHEDMYEGDIPPVAPSPPPTEHDGTLAAGVPSLDRDILTSGVKDEDEFPLETVSSKKSKKDKKKSKGKSDVSVPVTSLAEEEEELTQFATKKSKKDKKKSDKRKESLTTIDIEKAEAKVEPESGERAVKPDLDGPVTAAPTEMSESRDNEGAFDTESSTGLSERASRTSFPWDEAASTPPPDDGQAEPEMPALERESSFVPTLDQVNRPENDLGAFEEAFERAVRARGLRDHVTREEAMAMFMPRRNNAPFVAKGGLTPIGEGSRTTTPDESFHAEEQDPFDKAVPESKRSKKEKRKDKKIVRTGSKLGESVVGEDESLDINDRALEAGPEIHEPKSTTVDDPMKPLIEAAIPQEDSLSQGVIGLHPLGSEFQSREDDLVSQTPNAQPVSDLNVTDNAAEAESAAGHKEMLLGSEPTLQDAAEELSWLPTSKKDKKKKKKSQTSTPLETSTPAEPADDPVPTLETPKEETDDLWTASTSKKGKKGKKDKKKPSLDWNNDLVAPAAVATGTAVAAAILGGGDKTEPMEETEPLTREASISARDSEPPKELVEEDLASTPKKQSKKDKKKSKKGKSISLADLADEPEDSTVTPEDVAALQFSAKDLHEAPAHQNFLAGAHELTTAFPSRPSEAGQLVAQNSAKDFHEAPAHQAFLASSGQLASAFPSKPLEGLAAVIPVSAKELHEAPIHQEFLVGAAEGSSVFPSKPLDSSKAVPLVSGKDFHQTPAHQEFLAGATEISSAFPGKPESRPMTTISSSAEDFHQAPTHQEFLAGATGISSAFPVKPGSRPTATISSSAEDFHQMPAHREFLAGAAGISSAFPAKPLESSKGVLLLSAKDLHETPAHQDFLAGAAGNSSAFPVKPTSSPSGITLSSAKDLHETPAHQEFLAGASKISSTFPLKPREPSQKVTLGDTVPLDDAGGTMPVDRDLATTATAQEADDEFSFKPAKKSKKKKSKKRTSLLPDESITASPIDETAKGDTELPPTIERAVPSDAATATAEEFATPAETPIKHQEEDFAWQPTTKKSKKDKKKKKSLAWAEDDLSTPATQDSDAVDSAERQTGHVDESHPAAGDEVENHATFSDRFVDEPEEVIEEPPKEAQPGGNEVKGPAEHPRDGPIDNALKDISDISPAEPAGAITVNPDDEPDESSSTPASKKKGKKDKKKRGSALTLDEPTAMVEEPSALAVLGVEPEVTSRDAEPAPDEWGFSTKKSKKDKKKRKSVPGAFDFEEVDSENVSPGAQEPGTEDSNITQKHGEAPFFTEPAYGSQPTSHTNRGLTKASDHMDLQSESPIVTTGDKFEPIVAESEQAGIAIANEPEEWGFSTKKSKKEKKRNRQSTIEEPSESSSALPVAGVGLITGAALLGAAETKSDEVGGPPLDQDHAKEISTVDEQEQPIDWEADPWGTSTSTKKSKKNKKDKLQSTAIESPETFDNAATIPELTSHSKGLLADQQQSQERAAALVAEAFSKQVEVPAPEPERVVEEEEWGFTTKKSKKDKKKKRQSALDDAEMDTGSSTPNPVAEVTGTTKEPMVEQTRDFTMTEAFADPVASRKAKEDSEIQPEAQTPELNEFARTSGSKNSKNDKEMRQSTFDDTVGDSVPPVQVASEGRNEQYDFAAPNLPADDDVNDRPPSPKAIKADEEEWAVPTKKSKKDKKKKRQSTFDDLQMAESELPTPIEQSSGRALVEPNMELDDAERSNDDPRAVPDAFDEPARVSRSVDGHGPNRDVVMPDVIEAHTNESAPSRTKSKKGKKDKKGKRISIFEDENVNASERAIATAEPTRQTPASASIHDEAGHEPALVDSDTGSNVSASTRERRKRRRSPPVWTGGEPADLPRDRALTPPPDHDDIMDTALGVAAGLGFGASGQDKEPSSQGIKSGTTRDAPGWSFANMGSAANVNKEAHRDSGVQFADSPTVGADHHTSTRDSGFVPSPRVRDSWGKDRGHVSGHTDETLRPPRPQSPTSSAEDISSTPRRADTAHTSSYIEAPVSHSERTPKEILETPAKHQDSPITSTSKDRSSALFNSSPATQTPHGPHIDTANVLHTPTELRRSPSIHGHHKSREELRSLNNASHQRQPSDSLASNLIDRSAASGVNRAAFSPPAHHSLERPFSPTKGPLHTIPEHSQRQLSNEHGTAAGVAAVAAAGAAAMLAGSSRDEPGTKSLGRSKSRTSSSRNLRGSLTSPYDPSNFASSSSNAPVDERDQGEGATRDRDMADVYDGYGAYPGSPMSPTRPPSVRKRQSMQQIKDLETRVDQLANENRTLAEAKLTAERHLEEFHLDRSRAEYATEEAFRTATAQLRERDEEIGRLKEEVANLATTHDTLKGEHEQRYSLLQDEHSQTQSRWQESNRELDTLRGQHEELSTGMEEIVRHEIDIALAEKNAEIERLYKDLELAKEKIRELQSQILERGADDVIVSRDEDYFDNACQQLCQHVQQWVLRFSKFSDTRVCRGTNEVRDEKTVDRFDNAILDGSDVDVYLADRVKRRDVFMSVVMTMIWEYVFTRYLFGMDRDQRQRLKQLEKNLSEVGPASAIHQWRAMTLTLLTKREAFKAQRENDTEAVAIEIFTTLSKFLPPPQNLEAQIQDSLRNVMRAAVDLSIEMRTQRAEYIMLPPLQPEYDTNGDLARKVYFNASLMNERSGETSSNDELAANQAVVRMVLFPLVVKKGDDGNGEEEIVVCPAQVLVARPDKGKRVRTSGRVTSGGSVENKSLRAASTHSLAMSGVDMTGGGNMI